MRKLRLQVVLAAAAVGLLFSIPASAGDSNIAPTYGIKVYEVFQRGASLELQERTTRVFAPKHVRNMAVGEVFPPEGQPAMQVFKSRDSLGFFGSYWREDGSSGDYGKYDVVIADEGPGTETGVELIRVHLAPREAGKSATRRILHPEFLGAHDAKAAAAGK